jgi:hypothetical protein
MTHVVILRCIHIIDVVYPSEGYCRREILVEAVDRTGSIIEIFGVARRPPGVKVRFEDFGALDIIA